MKLRQVARGGTYFRVAAPGWKDPLDGSYSQAHGGRWNPPESFPVVYLCRSVAVARAFAWSKLAGLPYGPEDLDPQAAPLLVATEVPRDRFANCATVAGLAAAGLPPTYPFDEGGEVVGWDRCQPIGQRAWDRGFPGIGCRSAAPDPSGAKRSPGEELAWFQREGKLRPARVQAFEDWFWP